VGGRLIHFNKQPTRLLGVWLDSNLTPKEHHNARLKKARVAQTRLMRLSGQIGLSPEDCCRVQAACVQAASLFGAELWWKGEEKGTLGNRDDIQKSVNQEARANTGAFRTTNTGALSAESGLLPAAAQLNNRKRRFAVRLISLPKRYQARELVGAASTLGSSLESFP